MLRYTLHDVLFRLRPARRILTEAVPAGTLNGEGDILGADVALG